MLVITTTKKIEKLENKISERTTQLVNLEDELKDKDIKISIANEKINQLQKQLKNREELDLKSNGDLKVKNAKLEDDLLIKNTLLEGTQERLNVLEKEIEENKNKVAEAEKVLEENKQMQKQLNSYVQSVGLFKFNSKKREKEMKSIKASLAILGYEIVNAEVVKINSVKNVETAQKVNDSDKAAVLYDGSKKDLKKYISNGTKLEYVTSKKDSKEDIKEVSIVEESLKVDEIHEIPKIEIDGSTLKEIVPEEIKEIETDFQIAEVNTDEKKVISVEDKKHFKNKPKKKFNKKR